MSIKSAFDSFMQVAFEGAVDSSTKASWGGENYVVELFDNGTYRTLWSKQIGNSYVSPGLLLSVPTLKEEDWDEDPSLRYYDNAEEYMRNVFLESQHTSVEH